MTGHQCGPAVCVPASCAPGSCSPDPQQSLTESARALRARIGGNLLRLRRERRVTLKQLSRRTGLSTHLLDHFELGKSEIELRQILTIARALDTDWRTLLAEER